MKTTQNIIIVILIITSIDLTTQVLPRYLSTKLDMKNFASIQKSGSNFFYKTIYLFFTCSDFLGGRGQVVGFTGLGVF